MGADTGSAYQFNPPFKKSFLCLLLENIRSKMVGTFSFVPTETPQSVFSRTVSFDRNFKTTRQVRVFIHAEIKTRALVSKHLPWSSGSSCRCLRRRWRPTTAGQSQSMTSQRQPQLRCRRRRCRAGSGVAGRGVESDRSDLVQMAAGNRTTSGSSLRKRRGFIMI